MDTQETLDAAEKALDAVEAKLDVLIPETVEAVNIIKHNPYLLAGLALVAFSTGGAAGYILAKKRLEPKYAAIAEDEILQAKEFYKGVHKREEFATPADAVDQLIPVAEQLIDDAVVAMTQYQGHVNEAVEVVENERGITVKATVSRDKPQLAEVTSNIFVNNKPFNADDWDFAEEEASRSEEHPYVIHHDEFYENAQDFEQTSLTYYRGDDVLTDEKDEPIADVEGTVGAENLRRFGHGSQDENIVYVKNNKRGTDFEIALSEGKYGEEVLGFDDDHQTPRVRKFRGDDD